MIFKNPNIVTTVNTSLLRSQILRFPPPVTCFWCVLGAQDTETHFSFLFLGLKDDNISYPALQWIWASETSSSSRAMNKRDMCPPGPKHLLLVYDSPALSSLAATIGGNGGHGFRWWSHEMETAWIPASLRGEQLLWRVAHLALDMCMHKKYKPLLW